MRIITINVNGIRAAERKGFFNWLKKQNADVVCLQEIKAQEDQLDERFILTICIRIIILQSEKDIAGLVSIVSLSLTRYLIVRGMT